MIKSYILIALRTLQRNTVYSFINIAGLSVGLACSILILLWVADELSFDGFHEKYDRLYQVYMNQEISGTVETSTRTPYPVLEALQHDFPSIEKAALVNSGEGYLLSAGNNKVTKMGTSVSKDFLDLFTFNVIHGNPQEALSGPSSIVLTRTTANALFGSHDVVGNIVELENRHELKVSAVIEDVPPQSTLQFDFLLPLDFYEETQEWLQRARSDWRNNAFRIFAELTTEASVNDVNKAIATVVSDHNQYAPTARLFLFPMSQWHLYTEFANGKPVGGMIEYVRMFAVVGVLILVIACINFMNLATARSEGRAREVGIRKSVGSQRKQLIAQFLGESVFISAIAFLFAVMLVEVALPMYNILVNKTLSIDYNNPVLWVYAFAIVATTGLISGSYPAFYLSSFRPVAVLKGKFQAGKGSVTPRKVLVTLQFAFSIFLIIGSIVIYQQIMHVKSRHVGYDRNNLMLIWTTAEIEQNFQSLREELEGSGIVESLCKSSAPITRIFSGVDDVSWPGKIGNEKVGFVTMATEYGFTKTLGIAMLEGRDFSPDFKSDTSAIIINQAALDLMALKDPIGQKVSIWGDDRTIIGVMDDVIMGSPFHAVGPMALVMIPGWSSTISVRLRETSDIPAAVAAVDRIFKKFDPEHPLWYRFADDEFQTKFASINLIGRLAVLFSMLAVLISCLGLFGLAAFTAEQRTKEVGIRKILGASVPSLVLLISRDFSKLMIVAFIFAAPLAWWMLGEFLEQYPYRVDLQWWVLLLAGLGAFVLTIVIVSTQALRAARTNPVNSLRSE